MRIPQFFKSHKKEEPPEIQMQKQSYSKLADIRDELDQPLQPHIEQAAVNKCSYVFSSDLIETTLPCYGPFYVVNSPYLRRCACISLH